MHKVPLYFSNNLELKLNARRALLTDRAKLSSLLPSVIVGLLLVLLGVYEWLNAFSGGDLLPPDEDSGSLFFRPWVFDLCFIIIGLGVVLAAFFRYLSYNKYTFAGQDITIVHRRLFQGKKIIKLLLSDFSGVRFRVEFCQRGFLIKNRYIVELYHKNVDKMVPLYISVRDNNVRRKLKEYARIFKLPAVIFTDTGIKFVAAKDLSKSIASQYKQGLIEDTYDEYSRLPQTVAYARKKDKIVLKIRKPVWDVYNLLAWAALAAVALVGAYLLKQMALCADNCEVLCVLLGMCVAFIVIVLQVLFRKEKLVFKRRKIVNTHKYMLFSTKHNQLFKKDIEAVEVTENPATGRYFVSIISDDRAITFASKLPKRDLNWIKRFLIHEIIK
ncbi:MAG: hypothetical protein IJ529_05020 [Alphaproteobacteria bacterium]|nr:hypothetical protein [Alphaproteobacteria bacterium]MBQ9235267.1 hypothetical protein [Alphaproteobacteria bacterium]